MIKSTYNQKNIKKNLLLISLFIGILLLFWIALGTGSSNTSGLNLIATLFRKGDEISTIVIWNIRLPRILAAISVGAGLAIAGCVMQTSLRNPIASPSTLGISNAAAFGANLSIVLISLESSKLAPVNSIIIENPYMVTIFAFSFSMVATLLILALAKLKGFTPEAVVLSGVAIGSLFSAGSTLLQYFADDVKIATMVFWTFGDLGRINWNELFIITIVVFAGSLYFLFNRWSFNALDSGDATAISLGVDVDGLRFKSMALASLITAVSVSFVGIIGFVGLIAPQIMRRIIGEDHRFLIPSSALLGSFILLGADTIARTIIAPIILPVGTITSFLGAPLFLYLLMKGAKRI